MSASRTVRRLPLVLAALAAAPLVLGACGSSTDTTTTNQPSATSAPNSGTKPTTGTEPRRTTTTDPEDTTTTSKKKSTTTTEDDGGDGTTTTSKKPKTTTTGPVADSAFAEYCDVYIRYDNEFKDVDDEDPAVFPQIKAAYQELTDAAPAEIQADIGEVNAFIQTITNFEEFLGAPQSVKDASERLDDITEAKCGVS